MPCAGISARYTEHLIFSAWILPLGVPKGCAATERDEGHVGEA